MVRAGGCAPPRTQDLADLGDVLAAPRQRRCGLPRHQRPAQVRARRPRSRTRPGRTPTSSTATSRRPSASSRRSPGASSRSTAAASCFDGCSSATSSTSSTCGSPRRRRRRAAALPRAWADARPGAGRVAGAAVRRDDPDLSAERSRDVRQRRGVTLRRPAKAKAADPSVVVRRPAPVSSDSAGVTLGFTWKTLSGSHVRLRAARRATFASP